MNNEIVKKVNFIFKSFYEIDLNYWDGIKKNEKYFKNPMTWNMDTDIWNMIKRLNENINEFEKVTYIEIIKSNEINKNNNSLYFIKFNNKNITPKKTDPKLVAKSTTRQYCQILTCLGIVKFSTFKKEGFKLDCFNFKNILSNFSNMSLSIILNGQKSAIDWVRNLGFSLFLSILFYKNFDFKYVENNYKILEKKKKNKKTGKKFFHINDSYEEIEQMFSQTYKNLVINNFEKIELEEIINFLYENIKSNSNDYEIYKLIEEKNKKKEQSYHRSLFKKKIFNNRNELGLINSENDIYNDLIQNININDGLIAKWRDLHACHIYEVKTIKKNEESVELISNPMNGIMMKSEYHWAFDKGLFSFNENGEMIYREEDENYLFVDLNLKKCKIRREVFNEEMQMFLNKRF